MIAARIAQAIEQSGKSRYEIGKATATDKSVLFRLVNGGSCSLETADKLCQYLGLRLVADKQPKRR